jgi:hypothetical protein
MPRTVYLKTDSACTDPALRHHLPGYIAGALAPAASATMRTHLLGCLCCSVQVANAKAKMALARELGVSLDDPLVAAQLQTVTLVQPPCRRAGGANRRRVTLRRK